MIEKGQTIRVHYTGTLTDGTLFDSSEGHDPLEFKVGSGHVIKGFEDGVLGMEVGESKKIEIPYSDAYGPVSEDNIFTVNRLEIPEELELVIGGTLHMHEGEMVVPVIIREVSSTKVTLDANHPLAGKDLVFDITIESVL